MFLCSYRIEKNLEFDLSLKQCTGNKLDNIWSKSLRTGFYTTDVLLALLLREGYRLLTKIPITTVGLYLRHFDFAVVLSERQRHHWTAVLLVQACD